MTHPLTRETKGLPLTSSEYDRNLQSGGGLGTVADLLANNKTYSYWTAGDIITAGSYRYLVAGAGAAVGSFDLTTAGGVKLSAIPAADGFVTFDQLGAVGNGTTNDRPAFILAARGSRKVRGLSGKTYFIAVNTYLDSIRIYGNTYWEFPYDHSSKILWDYFGCALFFFHEADTAPKTIVNPHVVWNGTAIADEPHTAATLRTHYGGINGGVGSWLCHWLVAAADDVSLIRPRCSAAVPGPAKSFYTLVGLRAKLDGTMANKVTIESMQLADIVFGVQGSGFEEILMPGDHYCYSYAEYHTYLGNDWAAPGHMVYISDATGCEYMEVGSIFDTGNYLGPVAGDKGSHCFKLRFPNRCHVGSITSFRPHGVLDARGWRDVRIDNVYYHNLATTLDAAVMKFDAINDPTNACINVWIGTATIIVNAITHSVYEVRGDVGGAVPHQRVWIDNLNVTMNIANIDAVVDLRDAIACGVGNLTVNLLAAPGVKDLVAFNANCVDCGVHNIRVNGGYTVSIANNVLVHASSVGQGNFISLAPVGTEV